MKKFDEYKIVYDFCDAVQNNKNITTYGRKGDLLFNSNMQNQSGEIYGSRFKQKRDKKTLSIYDLASWVEFDILLNGIR